MSDFNTEDIVEAYLSIRSAREKLAAFLGCHALDVVFTSGATESANTVFHHAARTLASDTEVWLSAIEHPCVMEAARQSFPKHHRFIPVTRGGVAPRCRGLHPRGDRGDDGQDAELLQVAACPGPCAAPALVG